MPAASVWVHDFLVVSFGKELACTAKREGLARENTSASAGRIKNRGDYVRTDTAGRGR